MRASLALRSRLTSTHGLFRSTAAAAPRTIATPAMPPSSTKPAAAADASRRLNAVSRHMSSSQPHAIQASAPSSSSGPSGVSSGLDGQPVQLFSEGGLRTILLNREKALNAVNMQMVHLLNKYIDECTRSPNCHVILLRGKGRALCSGGDVLAIVHQADSSDPDDRAKSTEFFREEFQLDYMIARLGEVASINASGRDGKDARIALESKAGGATDTAKPKVFVSLMDGITMGGGVGLSVHAPLRIATERTRFAMPETGIGYFPDVGVTRVLARLDGKIGQYLGLTGAQISGEEAYLAGLATHYISSSSIDPVVARLASLPAEAASNPALVASAIGEFSGDPFGAERAEVVSKTPFLGDRRVALDYVFGQLSCESIFHCLEEIASGEATTQAAQELKRLGLELITPDVKEWARKTLDTLRTKSPRALKVTHQAILEARRFDVEEAFRFDMRLATAFCDLSIGRDFFTGVTHVLGRDPKTGKRAQGVAKWDPPSLEQVSDTQIRAQFFADVATAERAGLKMKVPELERVPKLPEERKARQARDAVLRGRGPGRWEPTFNVFALPSEAEVESLREGSHPASGAVASSDDELLDCIKRHKNQMVGIDVKLRDYFERTRRRQA